MILPSSLKAGFSSDSFSRLVSGADPLVRHVRVPVHRERHDLALEATLLGRPRGVLMRAQPDLVELRAGDLPLVGDHLGRDALRHEVVLLQQLGRPGRADVVDPLEAHSHRDVAHVLDAGSDGDVVHAGGDQRGGEVHGLLRGAALTIDGRGRRLDRKSGLEPGVAADVEHLLAVLLHAARDHVLDLGCVDSGALDDLGVGLPEQRVRMDVLVVALLRVPAPNRGACGLDDHDLSAVSVLHLVLPPRSLVYKAYSIDWRVNQRRKQLESAWDSG